MDAPAFPDLRAYLDQLRRDGDLVTVTAPVDARLEVAEIHRRVIAAGGPALLFTNVPTSFGQFARQRQRWSRGLMEAFARHGSLLIKPRMSTLFIWWNLLFLPLDLVYTLAFLPGLVLALFGYYYIAGVMTLLVLPLAMFWNAIIFGVQTRMFKSQDLRVRRNVGGFLFYSVAYTMLLQPVCVLGYAAELLRLRKTWGTK